ncbi:DUF1351 domain-containing protein [Lactobacillus crispatus]|jgi:hypothetical protein|uniref:DUF1351 domain-containing protein n=1 Tax=Lactobacillus crispatus TaxID=47770 RepID=UPI0010612357|nr:DUF1351 domain-containing protein [Lactobacillus crispatus]TDN13308.1 replication protein [Lactobacillus crispatus]WAZ54207.1 DUF1351 domain-containing protein [Lactobacillus crispatus]DAJ15620.1 MAG TPA: Protein of unknown function (DUF1351) [Siphoviridae sp. ctBfm1]
MNNQVKNKLIEFNPDFPVNYAPAQIDFKGFEDFQAQVHQIHAQAEEYGVTPDNLKEAKAIRAKLNSAKKKINQRKIEIVKHVEQPVKDFKDKIKLLLNEVDESSELVDSQIKEYEELARKKRREDNLKHIKAMCELANIDPDKIEYQPSWDNKTYSKNKFENEVDQQIALIKERQSQIAEAITTVTQRADKLGLPSEHWVHELKTRSLPDVLNEMDQYKEDLTSISKQQQKTKVQEAESLKQVGDRYIDPDTGEVKDKVITLKLEVKGTSWQMNQLHSFLKDNGIQYRGLEG